MKTNLFLCDNLISHSPNSYPKYSMGDLVTSSFPTLANKIGIVVGIEHYDKNFLEPYFYEIMHEDQITILMESWINKIWKKLNRQKKKLKID